MNRFATAMVAFLILLGLAPVIVALVARLQEILA